MSNLVPLSAASMFELYKKEKAAMDDELNPFPIFADWKVKYANERADEMEAVADSVAAMIEAEDNQIVQVEDTPVVKPTPKIVKNKPLTNMDKARTMYQQMVDELDELPARKDVIATFISQLKVSKACASTYHYNIKQKYS